LLLSFKQQIHASSEPSVSIDWNDATSNNDKTKLTANIPQAPAAGKKPLYFFLQLNPVVQCNPGSRETLPGKFELH